MIAMNEAQSASIAVELERVFSLALAATKAADTTAMIAALRSVSMASMNAVSVIRDTEAEIRMAGAPKEHA